MSKKWKWTLLIVLIVLILALVGGSFYMVNYSLAPDPERTDTTACFARQFDTYPETKEWVDSLRRNEALRDTFVTMDDGKRHHAWFVRNGGNRTALVLHGWRDCAIDFFYLARLYERELGYNVVMPDFHAHGLSEGNAARMGWLDRHDMIRWMEIFQSDTMVVHGVSMGGATAMMMSGEKMPDKVRDVRFVEDCGYTSVWDEFAGEMKVRFGLPAFPILHSSSFLCKLRYGWTFAEASALEQVSKSEYPMLFIHGDSDKFVPTDMVHELYQAKPQPKECWITENTEHASSYFNHKEEYIRRIKEFCAKKF